MEAATNGIKHIGWRTFSINKTWTNSSYKNDKNKQMEKEWKRNAGYVTFSGGNEWVADFQGRLLLDKLLRALLPFQYLPPSCISIPSNASANSISLQRHPPCDRVKLEKWDQPLIGSCSIGRSEVNTRSQTLFVLLRAMKEGTAEEVTFSGRIFSE